MEGIGVSAQSQTGSVPKSNADLALNVLQGLQNEGQTNPFFSPTSVFYGLSMLYYGMGNTSRNIMSASLGLPNSQQIISDELKVIKRYYNWVLSTSIFQTSSLSVQCHVMLWTLSNQLMLEWKSAYHLVSHGNKGAIFMSD